MNEILSQEEADRLVQTEKRFLSDNQMVIDMRKPCQLELGSLVFRDTFIFDITPSQICLSKLSANLRVRVNIPLVRLDIHQGLGHRNPDGSSAPDTHIHLYREGEGLKWAFALPESFTGQKKSELFYDFLNYCHIINQPLFSFGFFE